MLVVRSGPGPLRRRPAKVRSRSYSAGGGPTCPLCLRGPGRTARSEYGQ